MGDEGQGVFFRHCPAVQNGRYLGYAHTGDILVVQMEPGPTTTFMATAPAFDNREAAVAAMQELLALNPDHPDALNFVGYSFAERGVRLDEADKLVGRALELRPGNGYFMDSLGWVYFQKGDFGRAVALLEKADAVSGERSAGGGQRSMRNARWSSLHPWALGAGCLRGPPARARHPPARGQGSWP